MNFKHFFLIPKNKITLVKNPYADLWHCLNTVRFSCHIHVPLPLPDADQKGYCVYTSKRVNLPTTLLWGKALRCRLIKVKKNINTLQYFSESISQENQLIIKKSLCNYYHSNGAWQKVALSSHFFYFSWGKPASPLQQHL